MQSDFLMNCSKSCVGALYMAKTYMLENLDTSCMAFYMLFHTEMH
jgi:hypothetical protein